MKEWLNYCLIMALLTYVAVDLSLHHGTHWGCTCPGESPHPKIAFDYPDYCTTRRGHYETTSQGHVEPNPWNQMKWIGEAASCRVKGHLIEKLDDVNNFRRGYALKFSDDVEDKTFLLPWLLAARTPELAQRRRRVYIDLGANNFSSSVAWFLRMYPLDFTEVHAFEINPWMWCAPKEKFDENANFLPAHISRPHAVRVNNTPAIPPWMMERVKVYFRPVSDKDDAATNSVDVSRFIKEELRLTPDDTVIVKMDIEGAEWPILGKWLEDPLMPRIIDELFVEVHYQNPNMKMYGWDYFAPITRENAARMVADLRWRGFYAHFWP